MTNVWQWRYKQMKQYLENQHESLEPVESIKPNTTQLYEIRATISIIHDMMCRIEKQRPIEDELKKLLE